MVSAREFFFCTGFFFVRTKKNASYEASAAQPRRRTVASIAPHAARHTIRPERPIIKSMTSTESGTSGYSVLADCTDAGTQPVVLVESDALLFMSHDEFLRATLARRALAAASLLVAAIATGTGAS